MEQNHSNPSRAATIAPGLLARKGEARPSLARGFESAEHGLALPLIARGASGLLASPRITHRAVTQPCPHIARAAAVPAAMPAEEGRKAAFTLRLDARRHATLRAACAATQRSAQALITEALDIFLTDPRRSGAPLSFGG